MLEADILAGFKRAAIPRTYKAGEPIVLLNEPSTGMYLILRGEAKVQRRDLDGQLIEVATLGQGQTMGEVSLLLGQPHAATVTAKTDIDSLLLTRTRLQELKHEDPELALQLYEVLAFSLSKYLMHTNNQLDQARKRVHQLEKRLSEVEVKDSSIYSLYR